MVGISLVVKYMKGRQIRHFGLWKDQKGLRNAFYGCEIKRREIVLVCIGNSMICSVILGIHTTSHISKFLYVIWDNFEISRVLLMPNITQQIMLLFVYSTTRERFEIFTCGYLKWSWNTTALSQPNCRISHVVVQSDLFTLKRRWIYSS